jgi:predicted O-linked N-acetylglucosamine transferase (SPINDLY family)
LFTFGSLNQAIKLRPRVWRAWMEILRAAPNSRLVVLADAGDAFADTVRQFAHGAGIERARIEIVPKRSRYDYLALHQELDLALDSFPFNGHTTVCDALWMGVPSLTLEGTSYASRFGTSALRLLGLEEFIARSPEEYVRAAVGWTGRLGELEGLRQSLRERMRGSAMLDSAGFAHDLETAYRQMWRSWCQRKQ